MEEIKRIEIECGLSVWTAQDYSKEILRPDSLFYISKENSEITGFILARLIMTETTNSLENEAEIYNIGVRKSSRHSTIGSQLLNHLIKSATKKEVGKIYLEVRKSNTGAFCFYQKNSFVVIGERKNFYSNPSENAVLMCRYWREHPELFAEDPPT